MNRHRQTESLNEAAAILEELKRLQLIARRHLDTWNRIFHEPRPDRRAAEDCVARVRAEFLTYRENIRELRLTTTGAANLDAHAKDKEHYYVTRWERIIAAMPETPSNVYAFPFQRKTES